ncbi:MAG: TIGR03089 family protein, partial [Actinomycetota bacterium]|nr:TIGR03089 family protein [Actinomycetota bacterium]
PPRARVAVRLPLHWQGAVWVAACWAAGCVAAPGGDPGDADVVVVPTADAAAVATSGEVVALGLRPFAMPGDPAPPGVTDYDVEVRSYGDRFSPYAPVSPSAAALEVAGTTLDGEVVVEAAREAARRWGLAPGERILTTWPPGTLDGVLAALAAPLASGAAALLCPHPDPAGLAHLVEVERVTVVAGADVAGHHIRTAASGG